MQLFITKKIGKRAYPFVFDGPDFHALVMESEHLSFDDVAACGCCGSDNLKLTARIAEGFKYVSIKCDSCRADLTFGRTKADANTFFLRRDAGGNLEWKPFVKEATQ